MTTTPTAAPLSAEQLDKLEELALAATPGPWTVRLDGTCSGTWPHIDAGADEHGDPITIAELSTTHTETDAARAGGGMPGSYEEAPDRFDLTDQQPLEDAAFIAAANPATVLALIAQARTAEKAEPQLKDDIELVSGALDLCEPEEQRAFERILKHIGRK